ncbi:MAG: hypothetical protein ACI9W6_001817 [Motiliproteus sp.]|jgi:uncharacterized protein (DUF934 family)
MPKIIKDGGIVEDKALIVEQDAAEGFAADQGERCFLPLTRWREGYPNFDGFRVRPGIWIEADEHLDDLEPYLSDVPAIAVRFSSFADGSGFSTGALLREVYGFEAELRACGELIADQALQLRRCGFNAIALKEGECLQMALSMLLGSGLTYQGSVYSPRTPFRFRF